MCITCGAPSNVDCNCETAYCVPCSQERSCPIKLDSSCVIYHIEGTDDIPSKLTCLDVSNGTTVESILEQIDALICNSTNLPIVVAETFTAKMTASGQANHHLKTDVKVSEDDDNIIEIRPDGLYVPEGSGGDGGCCDLQDTTDIGNVTTNSIECTGLGVNTSPTEDVPFIVHAGEDGELAFDGVSLTVGTTTNNETSNVFVGDNSGNTDLGARCTAVGIKALQRATGINNTVVGKAAGISVKSDENTFIGVESGAHTDDGGNVFIGNFSGVHTYSDTTICIGNGANAGEPLYIDNTIPTSTINIGTSELKGTEIAAFLTAAGLSTGDKGTFSLTFDGAIFPPPIVQTPSSYKGYVTASDTIELQDAVNFTSIAGVTSPFTLTYYKAVTNAISIGYRASADDDNEIAIGNSDSTRLTVNKFIVNVDATPSARQFLKWNGAEYEPSNINSGTYAANGNASATTFVVTHGGGFTPSQVILTPLKKASLGAWVTTKTSTTFTINFDTAPAVGTNNVNFDWIIL